MNFPCPSPPVDCPGTDNPIINYSSEAPDQFLFLGQAYNPVNPPPLGSNWTSTGCYATCTSPISQLDADLCAQAQELQCVFPPNNPNSPTLFNNTPQSCAATCPDGLTFTFTVPSGQVTALDQTTANAQAHAIACQQAELQRVCFGTIPTCLCKGVFYTATLHQTIGSQNLTWMISAGALPPGMTLVGNGSTAVISGIPTASGQFHFTILGTEQSGNYMSKAFIFTVLTITTMTLPPFTIGTPYSFQLQASGGSGNYQWILTGGSLPAGLTMSASGLISGVPA